MIEGFRIEVISLLKYTWPTIVMAVIIAVLLRTIDLTTNKKKLIIHEELISLSFIIYIICLFYCICSVKTPPSHTLFMKIEYHNPEKEFYINTL